MDLVSDIEKAYLNLSDSSKILEAAFHQASQESLSSGGDEIPNPVDILNRLSAIESSLSVLKKDVHELVLLRPIVASETTAALLRNFTAIKELSLLVNGKDNENIHEATEILVNQTKQQHEFWKRELEESGAEAQIEAQTLLSEKEKLSEPTNNDTNDKVKSPLHHFQCQNVHDLSEDDFISLSESVRGRCKLEHIQNVATFIQAEVVNRKASGLKGIQLYIERQNLAKYCGSKPGLYSVIMNNSLWRDIVSTLQYLKFVSIEKDGLLCLYE